MIRDVLLYGRDHLTLGVVHAESTGAVAAAISKGGAAKRYAHCDPNEDAALCAWGPGGGLLAVADGHDGEHGAAWVLEHLRDAVAPSWCAAEPPARDEAGWCDAVWRAIRGANASLLERARAAEVEPAPTTLALAMVRSREGLFAHGCMGDSHVIEVGADAAREIGWLALGRERPFFLGYPEEAWHREHTAIGCSPLGGTQALVLATDGLSEVGIGVRDPVAEVARACASVRNVDAAARPIELARAVAARALEAQRRRRSGDNVATAAWHRDADRLLATSTEPAER